MSYATLADLTTYGLVSSALSTVDSATKQAALDAASERVDGYFRSRYVLPLTSWGEDVKEATVSIAVWILMVRRGFMPTAGADNLIRERYLDAVQWLNRVGRQEIQPNVAPTSAENPAAAAPRVLTHTQRGW
jgi:phage gp36-like protein